MKDIINKLKVSNGRGFSLQNFDPAYSTDYKKEDADVVLAELEKQIVELQPKLYAERSNALLILFQAMDAGGKDSAIAHTLSGLNPQGCEVHSFKQPGAEDLGHDFLWRHYKNLPESGRIGIHNRSHYENVLITKVHPELILQERLPGVDEVKDINKAFWEQRYESIRAFEKHLSVNGTRTIKFFLHVSKDEQKKRFLERINDPTKNWKFSSADMDERQYFDDYMKAYEEAIRQTATAQCPWYIIPADKKWFTRIAISTIILQTLKDFKLAFPKLSKAETDQLELAKQLLNTPKFN